MASSASTLLTVDDYRELPEVPPQYQLIEGKLHMSPSPNLYHQVISRNVLLLLANYLEKNPLGEVFSAPSDVHLTEYDVYQPDLFYVSAANAAILTEQGASGPPDLIIEILSPATERLDREVKRKVYAQAGVAELWLVDPAAKAIHLFRLHSDASAPFASYALPQSFASELFPGLAISVAEIFKPSRLG